MYNGSSAQAAGDGLPATVRDLTLNNSNGLTIAANVAVSGILTFTAGKITTGSNELQVTNASTTSISGYSNAKYVIGNLRRTVNASGTYDFPLGTAAYYEILTLKLTSTSGFSSVLAGFTSASIVHIIRPCIERPSGTLNISACTRRSNTCRGSDFYFSSGEERKISPGHYIRSKT